MRIDVKILNSGATLNSFERAPFVEIHQGETLSIFFQFIDKDQDDLRFVPASGAVVLAEIARFADTFGTISNQREIVDFSIRRNATQPFAGDASIWELALTSTDTDAIMSSNMRFTLTEGSVVTKSLVPQAIKVIPKEGMFV